MWVFKADLKAERLEIDCNSVGKEFHKSTTDIKKDLSLTVLRREERCQTGGFRTTLRYAYSMWNIKLAMEILRGIRNFMKDLVGKKKDLELSSSLYW